LQASGPGATPALDGKVLRDVDRVHWLDGGARLWYRVRTGVDAHEFVLVDVAGRRRGPAFDHQRLASALTAAGIAAGAQSLPLTSLELSTEQGRARFRVRGQWWSADLSTYQLRKLSTGQGPAPLNPRASERTGPPTRLSLINNSAGPVDLVWRGFDGRPRTYAKLQPGGRSVQSTYSGHVWWVVDARGQVLRVIEAGDDPEEVEIQAESVPVPLRLDSAPDPAQAEPAQSVSPDGRTRVRAVAANLLLTRGGAAAVPLTSDGTASDGYQGRVSWSPDSRRLVAYKVKPGQDSKLIFVESSPPGQTQPRLHQLPYRRAGDRIPTERMVLFDLHRRGRGVVIPDDLFPTPWDLGDPHWSPDGRRFTFVYNQRGHQLLRLIEVDAEKAVARTVLEERSPTFIDYHGKFFQRMLDDSGEIIWMSERDGWNHLYLFDARTGRTKNQITQGSWVVRGVEHVDEASRRIWFLASGIVPGQDPYFVHLARVNFDGSDLQVLTSGNGDHQIAFSPDRRSFVDTWSRVDLPPVRELRDSQSGALLVELERADMKPLLATGWIPPEPFVAKGRDGKTDIWGVIIRPARFSPERKYPVVERIYAGPQSSHVPKQFGIDVDAHRLADNGLVVVQIDGMGTSNRSKAFHDVSWKNLGDAGFADRILWIKAAAARYPYLDPSKVGIHGGSAGGQSAMRALLAHGDFYKVAVADCGCHDNRVDKIWWNELWMGWPVGPHYAEQSNVTQAHRLTGQLLLMVGEMDDNTDPASTMQVVRALVEARKFFEMLVLPGVGHCPGGTWYGRWRRDEFLVRHLLGPGRPSQRGDAGTGP
jgi:dipeptidyl-peptidase 4